MTNMRDLTVLIPTWNDAEALSVTLTAFTSLPTELKDRLDVVVSDGASSDHTLDVLSAHVDLVRRVSSRPDRGVYDAMNLGMACASEATCGWWGWGHPRRKARRRHGHLDRRPLAQGARLVCRRLATRGTGRARAV